MSYPMNNLVQPFVLAAGAGSKMAPLVKNQIKCLLPVGNFPMLYYPLHLLEKYGFSAASVVVSTLHEEKVRQAISELPLKISVELLTTETSDDPGTAATLRKLSGFIKMNVTDVLILSSDLITDVCFMEMLNKHANTAARLTVLTGDRDYQYHKSVYPGPKAKVTRDEEVICFEKKSGRLMRLVPGGEYDDQIELYPHMMEQLDGELNATVKIFDAHMYLMNRQFMRYILDPDTMCAGMSSLQNEVIPHVIDCQFTPKLGSKLNKKSMEDFSERYMTDPFIREHNQNQDGLIEKLITSYHHEGLCLRVNTMSTYWHLNRTIVSLYPALELADVTLKSDSANINPKSQICLNSVVGRNTTVEEKTNLKNTILGTDVRIPPMVQISNSVISDKVFIASGSKIDGSIVCVSLEVPCTIQNSIITEAASLKANGVYKDVLM